MQGRSPCTAKGATASHNAGCPKSGCTLFLPVIKTPNLCGRSDYSKQPSLPTSTKQQTWPEPDLPSICKRKLKTQYKSHESADFASRKLCKFSQVSGKFRARHNISLCTHLAGGTQSFAPAPHQRNHRIHQQANARNLARLSVRDKPQFLMPHRIGPCHPRQTGQLIGHKTGQAGKPQS